MNLKNKLQYFFFLLLVIMPFKVLAYSDYVVVGGNNIGIEVNTNGIMVVGFYEVNAKHIGKEAGFFLGDVITKINGEKVDSINDMANKINNAQDKNNIKFTILRGTKEKDIKMNLYKDIKGIYKTGLYVKDKITGIGTLTYIDPNTKIYGALGHEILEVNSNVKIEVKDGKIFKANITGINKSTKNSTGEKKAVFEQDIIYGNIKENTISGIYGEYLSEFSKAKLAKVASPEEIKIGPATIRTVLKDNKIEEYDINIIKINKTTTTKNILFEVSDSELKEKTNGIIKGMSGSPIIQNNMIVGAVTHAIVNEYDKGYGIFITTMLKEGEN